MSQITTGMVKELRERTQAGMLDCKKALKETDGDIDKAIAFLRKKGLSKAAKKAGRAATEGAVVSYIHPNNRIGVLLEVNCETDFVASNPDFQQFCRDVAMQIAAMNPESVRREEIPAERVDAERAVFLTEANMKTCKACGALAKLDVEDCEACGRALPAQKPKPENVIEKIVAGKVEKYYSERVLLEQKFVKEDKKTVQEVLTELVAKIGENIQVRRFERFELGEGLARKEENFAAEVAAQVAASAPN
jgi:elongation factor Ts